MSERMSPERPSELPATTATTTGTDASDSGPSPDGKPDEQHSRAVKVLNVAVAELSAANAALAERCDTLEIILQDTEAALAEALAQLAERCTASSSKVNDE
jgi:hypothetical protein